MISLRCDAPVDPDAALVARAQNGDLGAFEELIDRHRRRVFRALMAIVGDTEEARDAMQDTFLKAFEHIGRFQGHAKFSTWLRSIAINTAIQRLRDLKCLESLNCVADWEDGSELRPRHLWTRNANPEQLYSKAEMHRLVQIGLTKVPLKYRQVLALRDIEQLSTEETALMLGLSVSAVKARLFRARTMLREVLTSHFRDHCLTD